MGENLPQQVGLEGLKRRFLKWTALHSAAIRRNHEFKQFAPLEIHRSIRQLRTLEPFAVSARRRGRPCRPPRSGKERSLTGTKVDVGNFAAVSRLGARDPPRATDRQAVQAIGS